MAKNARYSFVTVPTVLSTQKNASSYQPEIDGIRAFAVLIVIINHFSEALLPSGFLGVDIFFVLSGYVVSKSIAERPITHWGDFLIAFYARRMKRIVPALVFCVAITALVGCLFIPHPATTLKAGIYALIGASNIYFFSRSSDYFGDDARHNLFTHTWSLGIEEQFYLIFPILFLLASSRSIRAGLGNLLIPVLGTLVALSLLLWFYVSSLESSFAYFMIPTRFWELGLGCLVYFVSRNRTIDSAYSQYISAISFLLMLGIPFLHQEQAAYTTVALCLSVAALLYSMSYKGLVVHILSLSWMVRIGLLSYSLYLWHWPVISISRHTIGINAYTLVPQVALICVLAIVSYRLIERPCRYGIIIRQSKSRNILLAGAAAIILAASLLYGLNKVSWKLFSANNPTFKLVRPVFSLSPTFEQCASSYDFGTKELPCYFSNPQGVKGALWLIGDSATWALKGMASDVSTQTGLDVAMFADDMAFPATSIMHGSGHMDRWKQHKDFYIKTFAYVYENAKAGDIVLITADIMSNFCVQGELYCKKLDKGVISWVDESGTALNADQALQGFLDEMAEYSATLRTKGVHVVLKAPLPRWERGHAIYCERQWFKPYWENEKCYYPDFAAQQQSRARILSFFRKTNSTHGTLVYDPFPYLCNEQACDFSNPETNENYWIDEAHLSNAGGSRLAPDFIAFLKSNRLIP